MFSVLKICAGFSEKKGRSAMLKFSCEKALLQMAVNTASRTVATKSSIPALEGLLLEGEEVLTLSGYNMQTGIRTRLEADIREQGRIVLNSRLFGDIIRKMPDDVIVFSADEKFMVTLTCGDARFEILGLSADDYPEMPEVDSDYSFTLQQGTLKAMINQTSFAVSTNENRPIHTGSLFEVEMGGVTVVSVDGFRLALRREALAEQNGSFEFVVPGVSLSEVEKICRESEEIVHIHQGARHILFKMGDTILISRRLEGDFLAWRQAIPRNNPVKVTADTKQLLSCIDRVSLIVSEKLKSPLRCVVGDGQIDMTTRTALGNAHDCCPIDGSGNGLEIGFNNKYMMDALKAAPQDKVTLELSSPITPCIIVPAEGEENFLFMVLPVRLKAES